MDLLPALVAALVGAVAGWLAGSHQHWLYRQPEFRAAPATGRARRRIQFGCAIAAAIVAAVAFRPDHYDFAPALITAASGLVLIVLSSADFERRLLPNRLMYPALVGAVGVCLAWPDRTASDIAIGAAVGAAVGVGLVVLGVLAGAALGVRATAFGIGDAKLILLIGLLVGWPAIVNALFIGILSAGVPSFLMIVRGRGRSVFSYGPYLAFGGLIVLLWHGRFA